MGIENYKKGTCDKCMNNSTELCENLDDWPIKKYCGPKNNYAEFVEYDGRYGKYGPLAYDHENMKWHEK